MVELLLTWGWTPWRDYTWKEARTWHQEEVVKIHQKSKSLLGNVLNEALRWLNHQQEMLT